MTLYVSGQHQRAGSTRNRGQRMKRDIKQQTEKIITMERARKKMANGCLQLNGAD